MNYLERKKKLSYLLSEIMAGRCTNLTQMANKLDCSTSTIKRMIRLLKQDGNVIKYSQATNRFYVKNS